MNTLSILVICGFVYLMFVTWIFRRKENGNSADTGNKDKVKTPQASPETQQPSEAAAKIGDASDIIPKSDFDMDRFRQVLTESMAAAMTYVLNAKTGDVSPEQVEFKNPEDRPSGDTSGDGGQEENPAEPTIDDVEQDTVSPPASGDSIEDIEAALDIAARPEASPDEKAKAGKVLSGMRDVVFVGKIMATNDRINEGIMACVAESMRRQPRRKKSSPVPKKKNRPIDMGGVFRDPDMIKRKKDEDEED